MTDFLGRDALTTIISPERSGNPGLRRDGDRASDNPTAVPGVDLASDEIVIVDDDPEVRDLLSTMFVEAGYQVTTFSDGNSFIAAARALTPACVILDVYMPSRSGIDILKALDAFNYPAPILMISGAGDIPLAVDAIRNGAFDFIEKRSSAEKVVKRVAEVIEAWTRCRQKDNESELLSLSFPGCKQLTPRERDVLMQILAASSNKETARNLGISQRTVEVHRAHIMLKLGAKNIADLVRIVAKQKPWPVPRANAPSQTSSHGEGDLPA